jgi:hypothetical protein
MCTDFSVVQLVASLSTDRAITAPSGRGGEEKILPYWNLTSDRTVVKSYPVFLLTSLSRLHLYNIKKVKFLTVQELVLRSLGRSARSQSLY